MKIPIIKDGLKKQQEMSVEINQKQVIKISKKYSQKRQSQSSDTFRVKPNSHGDNKSIFTKKNLHYSQEGIFDITDPDDNANGKNNW